MCSSIHCGDGGAVTSFLKVVKPAVQHFIIRFSFRLIGPFHSSHLCLRLFVSDVNAARVCSSCSCHFGASRWERAMWPRGLQKQQAFHRHKYLKEHVEKEPKNGTSCPAAAVLTPAAGVVRFSSSLPPLCIEPPWCALPSACLFIHSEKSFHFHPQDL